MGRRRKMVLVVSDNVVQQSVTSFMVRTWGFQCATASSLDQAAQMLAQREYAVMLSFVRERPLLVKVIQERFTRTAIIFVGRRPADSAADAYVLPDIDKSALRDALQNRAARKYRHIAHGEAAPARG